LECSSRLRVQYGRIRAFQGMRKIGPRACKLRRSTLAVGLWCRRAVTKCARMESVAEHKGELLDHGDIEQAETQELPVDDTREGEAGEATVTESFEGIPENVEEQAEGMETTGEEQVDSTENGLTAEDGAEAEIVETEETGEGENAGEAEAGETEDAIATEEPVEATEEGEAEEGDDKDLV
jgi:hypothetical protein